MYPDRLRGGFTTILLSFQNPYIRVLSACYLWLPGAGRGLRYAGPSAWPCSNGRAAGDDSLREVIYLAGKQQLLFGQCHEGSTHLFECIVFAPIQAIISIVTQSFHPAMLLSNKASALSCVVLNQLSGLVIMRVLQSSHRPSRQPLAVSQPSAYSQRVLP